MKISVIGLGKLGSPMVAAFASRGHIVVGVDVNEEYVHALNDGRPPIDETGLGEMIKNYGGGISATANYRDAVLATDITFIVVPTPTGSDGTFSLKYVLQAIDSIGKALRDKMTPHLVVLCSTVMPGASDYKIIPALELAAGKNVGGPDLGYCYNPEFIALGSVIQDMLNPDLILIGEGSEDGDKHSSVLVDFYRETCHNKPTIKQMNYVNAELSKISINTFVTTKISYANMLAEICEALPRANVDIVTDAIGCDSRIGHKYLKGALGYGGPCFPRDNRAFAIMARKLGIEPTLAVATDDVNNRQVDRIIKLTKGRVGSLSIFGVAGLSYKPDTGVIEESQGIAIVQKLLDEGHMVVVYDPMAMENAKKVLTGDVIFAESFKQCAKISDVLIIATPWKEFSELVATDCKTPFTIVIDCWRVLANTTWDSLWGNYIQVGA